MPNKVAVIHDLMLKSKTVNPSGVGLQLDQQHLGGGGAADLAGNACWWDLKYTLLLESWPAASQWPGTRALPCLAAGGAGLLLNGLMSMRTSRCLACSCQLIPSMGTATMPCRTSSWGQSVACPGVHPSGHWDPVNHNFALIRIH